MDIVSAKGSANNNRINVNGDYSSSAAANNHGSFNIPQRSLTVDSGNYQAISNNLPINWWKNIISRDYVIEFIISLNKYAEFDTAMKLRFETVTK